MDEMNNVMMENETSVETTPVEVVPESAVDITCTGGHEKHSGMNATTIVVGGLVVTGLVVGGVKWAAPRVKKGFNRLMEKVAKRKNKDSEDVEENVVEETSDEE